MPLDPAVRTPESRRCELSIKGRARRGTWGLYLLVAKVSYGCRRQNEESTGCKARQKPGLSLNGRENLSESGQIMYHRMWSGVSHGQD